MVGLRAGHFFYHRIAVWSSFFKRIDYIRLTFLLSFLFLNSLFRQRFVLNVCAAFLIAANSLCAQFWQPYSFPGGLTHQYSGGFLGGGVSMADFDKDGWDDVFLCGQGSDPLLLKSINGDLQPWPSGISNSGEMKQVTWVDFDNDGDRDLSITGLDMPVRIFVNDSNAFTPLPTGSGISPISLVSYGHSWGDYDLDGDLDLFVCNYDAQFMGYVNSDNQLYRNDGGGNFTDVSVEAGFVSMVNYTFMALWMDYNRDLYPDLLVINDRYEVPNYFYHNNGDGTFTEISEQANLNDYIFGMTATADDFDNDGDLDIYITNGTSGNFHKRNNGDGTFTDIDEEQGTTLNRFCWAAQFVDANRDGWQDLHICSTPHIGISGQNFLYLNNGQSYFNATDSSGIAFDNGWSRSSAIGDFNRDGMADVAVCKSNPSFSSLWSGVSNDNHWLKVTLEGAQSNRDGVSTWIDLFAGASRQSRYTYCGEGYLSQNSFSEFFGVGEISLIDSLVLHWPSGVVDRWYRIPANQELYLVEGSSQLASIVIQSGTTLCANDSLEFSIQGEWSSVQWNIGVNDSSVTIVEAGPLVAMVHDEMGNAFYTDTTWIVGNEPPDVQMNVQNVSCNGLSDGVIEFISDTPLQFYVNGMVTESNWIGGVGAGIFEVGWGDEHGCFYSSEISVEQPFPFVAHAITQNVSCAGEADGAVTFEYSGGTPSYYLLAGNELVSELPAGNYVYIASDANGCLQSLPVTIEEPQTLSIDITVEPQISEMQSGSISCLVSGGTSPYSFALNGEFQSDSAWFNLASGVYLVSVFDSMGCSIQEEVMVDVLSKTEEVKPYEIEIFPNPARQNEPVFIQAKHSIRELRVFTSDGSLVYQVTDAHIPLLMFRSGIYYVQVVYPGSVRSYRLAVIE